MEDLPQPLGPTIITNLADSGILVISKSLKRLKFLSFIDDTLMVGRIVVIRRTAFSVKERLEVWLTFGIDRSWL